MSKTITDEKIKLSIIIDGNNAQKELFDLEKATRKLTEETKGLTLQKKLLEKQGKQETEQYKLLTATIKSNNAEVAENKLKMQALQKEIGLTGLTMNQLNQKATVLRMTLKNLVPGSEDYAKYKAELTQVTNRISELSGKAQQSKFSLSSMADGFNKYQGLFLSAAATVTGVVFSVQKIIDINGKLSDSQADVMKTTGMNKKEVDELTKSFGALETRTSRIDLLKIAEQGGRIGIAKEEIGDFVNVMNKASVALGDSFTGGAEEVSNKLGKIKFLFEETKNLNVDKAYNAIGSAINDLGANGVASEANIAEFTTRIGSLTDVLKPTIQETLALGTAFEESGIEAEVSARAYNIFMKQASTESAKFAQVMGISKKSVEDMINTNPLDFMMKFAEGMRGMDATETAKTLDFLGVNADGANKVIGAMGNNMARFRELIDLSNNSFASGTSLVNEYNVKNENLAATLEKISKKVSGWFSSETFVKYLGGAVMWFAKFIGATEDADGKITKWKNNLVSLIKIISVIAVGMISYTTALKLVSLYTNGLSSATTLLNIAQKANALTGGILKAVYTGLQYIFYTLTIQTDRATIAQQRFNLATKTNPIGALVGLIMAAVAAYVIFSKEVDKSAVKQQHLSDVRNEANKAVLEEKTNLENLLKIARDETQSKANREAAIKRINEISPEYLKNITLETINTNEAKKAIDDYLVSLDKKAMKEAFASKRADLSRKLLDAVDDPEKSKYGGFFQGKNTDFKNIYELEKTNTEKFKQLTNGWNSYKVAAYKEYKNAIIDAEDQLKSLSDEEQKFIKKNGDLYTQPTTPTTSDYNVPGGTTSGTTETKNPNSSQEEINKLLYENEAKYAELSLRLRRQLEDDKIAAMKDGAEKEIAIENLRFQREIEDLEKQKVHKDELLKMDEEIAKAKKDKDQTRYDALVQIRKGWHQKNIDLDNQVNQIIEQKTAVHYRKLNEIEEKAFQDSIKQITEKFEHEKLLRETDYNLALAALGNNETEKLKLKKEFDNKELEAQKQHLIGLANLLRFQMSSMGAFNLLTPEAKDKMQKDLDTVLNAIAKIQSAQSSNTNDPTKEADLGLGGSSNILGYSDKQWEAFLSNIENGTIGFQTMTMAIGAATAMYSQFDQLLTASENAQLKKYERASNAKKQTLKKQLDSGMISQTYYNRHIEKLDKDLDRQKAELEYKQAKRQRVISIANIIQSTAQALIGLWAKPGFPAAIPLMGIVGALGALQLATVMKTPLPAKGYEKGLYGDYVKREQDGKVFQAQYGGTTKSGVVTKPTYFLTGENGPEMIIDKRAYASLSSGTRDSLLRELRGIKGYEQGLYNQQTKRYEVPATPQEQSQAQAASGDMQMIQMMMTLMSKNIEVLEDLRDNGVFVTNKDLKSMKYLRDGIKSYEELRTKAKQ